MSKQEYYRREYQRLNPGWQESMELYRDLISSSISSKTKVLDVGCGHGDFLKSVYKKTAHTYGVDPDKQALAKNKFIKHKVVAEAQKLPFADNFFDLVVSAWVLEHLTDPQKAFSEIFRVLKPGGKVIFLTPNLWNYNVWLIRLIPNMFHDFLTRKLYNRQENDTYPKQYKINSASQINKILIPTGFKKQKLILNGDPSYISFNQALFKLACLMEKLLDFKPLQFMRVHLIGVYEK